MSASFHLRILWAVCVGIVLHQRSYLSRMLATPVENPISPSTAPSTSPTAVPSAPTSAKTGTEPPLHKLERGNRVRPPTNPRTVTVHKDLPQTRRKRPETTKTSTTPQADRLLERKTSDKGSAITSSRTTAHNAIIPADAAAAARAKRPGWDSKDGEAARREAAKNNRRDERKFKRKEHYERKTKLQQENDPVDDPASRPFAYVFYLGGVTINEQQTNTNKDGLLHNVLVSVHNLRDSGSTASMVLLVQTVEPDASLPPSQLRMLHAMGIETRYVPHYKLVGYPTNYMNAIALEKYRVFAWSEYTRVLLLDADIMPHCSLDYLFEKSVDGTLKGNVLLSIGDQPASPSFLLVKPQHQRWSQFLYALSRSRPSSSLRLMEKTGAWTSLQRKTEGRAPQINQWSFAGRDSDAGALYSFARFYLGIAKGVSIVVGDELYSLPGDGRTQRLKVEPSPVQALSCVQKLQRKDPSAQENTRQEYPASNTTNNKEWFQPSGVAPYQDVALWSLDRVRPWNLQDLPTILARPGATKQWFKVLTKLDRQHQWGLGLAQGNYSAHWQEPPRSSIYRPLVGFNHEALKVWANHQMLATKGQKQSASTEQRSFVPKKAKNQRPQKLSEKKRAFVCITGQLERLELQNKIKRLFQPIQQKGYQLDVALVVTEGNITYTNFDRETHNETMTQASFYPNFYTAHRDLKRKKINVLSSAPFRKIENPHFNGPYFSRLQKMQPWRDKEVQKQRVLNHARVFESYNGCLEQAQQAIQTAGSTLEEYYDVFFRIREDVGFEQPLSEEVLSALLHPSKGTVQVTGCRSWGGMNDRFASVSPTVAEKYFSALYKAYIAERILDKSRPVFNPETFLLNTFLNAGINVMENRELKGLYKIIKDEEGETIFSPTDIAEPECWVGSPYVRHLIELYGWAF